MKTLHYAALLILSLCADLIFAQDPTPAQIMAGVRPRGACRTTYTLAIPGQGHNEIYVSPNGNNSNAGTRQSPMASITEASKKATAGDVITVANGTYLGGVTIHANGTQALPVVIQAEECGKVTVTSNGDQRIQAADWRGGDGNSSSQVQNLWITFRGFVVSNMYTIDGPETTGGGDYAAMRIANGWTVSDCVFDGNTVGVDIRAHYSRIEKSEFRNGKHLSILGAGNQDDDPGKDWIFTDLLITNNNTSHHNTPNEGSIKLLYTVRAVVDNVESWSNNGPGWWFDWHNSDFTVKNSYLHDNNTGTFGWDAVGLWSEVNDGGLIENNVFANNEGAGIGLLESKNMEIRKNLLVNDEIEFRCMNGRGLNIENINIHHNTFLNSSADRSIPDGCGNVASTYNVAFDYNTYAGTWSYNWENTYSNLSGMKSLGWEANGKTGAVIWPQTPDSSLWDNQNPLPPDTTPVAIPATGLLQAESADVLNGLEVKAGFGLGFSNGDDWAMWKNLVFDGVYTRVVISYGTVSEFAGQAIEIRLDSPTGALLATITTKNTNGWESFTQDTAILQNSPTGRHNLYVIMKDQLGKDWVADIDYVQFLKDGPTGIGHKGFPIISHRIKYSFDLMGRSIQPKYN